MAKKQEAKVFMPSNIERRAFRTPRRAKAREAGRSFTLSDRLARCMRDFLPLRSALILVLVASGAMAKEREPVSRNLYLSGSPSDEVRPVYVAGELATVLRFQQPCTEAGTKLLGWEGRFEPVECVGKKVLIEPLQDLEPEDRFLLLVTLADGKELPFTVTAREGRVDHQVNVFLDLETPEAARRRLADAYVRERTLEEENERLRKEQASTNHAYASLLAGGEAKHTPSHRESKWRVDLGGAVVDIYIYSARKMQKAAVLFHVTNRELDVPWTLKEVQDGPVHLVLELFRHDGLQQAVVLLDHRIVADQGAH
jgi:hypothetical protein